MLSSRILVVFSLWFILMCFRTLNILLLLESVFFTLRYTWDVCMMCRDRNHWATHKQRMCVNRNKCEKCLNLNRDSCIEEHKVWNGQTKEIHTLSYNRYLKLNTWKLANCTQFVDSATRVRLINKLKIDDTPRLDFEISLDFSQKQCASSQSQTKWNRKGARDVIIIFDVNHLTDKNW